IFPIITWFFLTKLPNSSVENQRATTPSETTKPTKTNSASLVPAVSVVPYCFLRPNPRSYVKNSQNCHQQHSMEQSNE
ncbi:hypothetical protein JYU14_05310, partial [Simkania negevensis]|nr:hypothetical protein [Simkania negevensis]